MIVFYTFHTDVWKVWTRPIFSKKLKQVESKPDLISSSYFLLNRISVWFRDSRKLAKENLYTLSNLHVVPLWDDRLGNRLQIEFAKKVTKLKNRNFFERKNYHTLRK